MVVQRAPVRQSLKRAVPDGQGGLTFEPTLGSCANFFVNFIWQEGYEDHYPEALIINSVSYLYKIIKGKGRERVCHKCKGLPPPTGRQATPPRLHAACDGLLPPPPPQETATQAQQHCARRARVPPPRRWPMAMPNTPPRLAALRAPPRGADQRRLRPRHRGGHRAGPQGKVRQRLWLQNTSTTAPAPRQRQCPPTLSRTASPPLRRRSRRARRRRSASARQAADPQLKRRPLRQPSSLTHTHRPGQARHRKGERGPTPRKTPSAGKAVNSARTEGCPQTLSPWPRLG